MGKRQDYICWDEYFMGIALLSAQRSKDASTQVGACIVSSDNKILSVGDGAMLDTKYPFVCHAELNAILNTATGTLRGAKVYVTLFPCNECAKAIIQCGIREVIYLSDKYADTDATRASKKMFDMTGVQYTPYRMTGRELVLKL